MKVINFLTNEEQKIFSVTVLSEKFSEIMRLIENEGIHLISCLSTKISRNRTIEVTIECNSQKNFYTIKSKLETNLTT